MNFYIENVTFFDKLKKLFEAAVASNLHEEYIVLIFPINLHNFSLFYTVFAFPNKTILSALATLRTSP